MPALGEDSCWIINLQIQFTNIPKNIIYDSKCVWKRDLNIRWHYNIFTNKTENGSSQLSVFWFILAAKFLFLPLPERGVTRDGGMTSFTTRKMLTSITIASGVLLAGLNRQTSDSSKKLSNTNFFQPTVNPPLLLENLRWNVTSQFLSSKRSVTILVFTGRYFFIQSIGIDCT